MVAFYGDIDTYDQLAWSKYLNRPRTWHGKSIEFWVESDYTWSRWTICAYTPVGESFPQWAFDYEIPYSEWMGVEVAYFDFMDRAYDDFINHLKDVDDITFHVQGLSGVY